MTTTGIRTVLACTALAVVVGCGDGGGSDELRFETLAGGAQNVGDGGLATTTFVNALDIAVDAAGNVFLLDDNAAAGFGLVRRVDARRGTISTVAGACGFDATPELAGTACELSDVAAIAAHDADELVVTTFSGALFRIAAPSEQLQHLAGRAGRGCTESADAPALAACLGVPDALAFDAAGRVYLGGFNEVRRLVAPSEPLALVAGTPADVPCAADAHDPVEEPAIGACLRANDIALDPAGNVVIANRVERRIQRIDASGILTTIAGRAGACPEGRGDGGPALDACFELPESVAVAANGDVFVADLNRIRRIAAGPDVITTVATGSRIERVAAAPDGSIVYPREAEVRRLDPASGANTTVAGNGTRSFCGDGASARTACLGQPIGIALDGAGNVLVADAENARIRRIDAATGITTTVAGSRIGFCGDGGPATAACFRNLTDLAFDDAGNLFVADRGDDDQGDENDIVGRVRRIDAVTGIITTVMGDCTDDDSSRASTACLDAPKVLLFAANGDLIVGEAHGIRRVDLAADTYRFVVGAPPPSSLDCHADGIPARSACLAIADLALDAAGTIYVLDLDEPKVRRIDAATNEITTVAGNGVFTFDGTDGVAATSTSLFPFAIVVDRSGRLILADGGVFRSIDLTSGRITTFDAGVDGRACVTEAPTPERCLFPSDLEIDPAGRLVASDQVTRRIQRATLP